MKIENYCAECNSNFPRCNPDCIFRKMRVDLLLSKQKEIQEKKAKEEDRLISIYHYKKIRENKRKSRRK